MKLAIQYLHDANGKTNAVQLPLTEWEKIVNTIKKHEQLLSIKSDLRSAFAEVEKMRKVPLKKQTLSDFLNEL
ncbi:MAG: hypothetical protein ABI763_05925 [Bacteroidota bacterium]